MKSICFALVAVSLISPASAGRVREALMEFDKEYKGEIAAGKTPAANVYKDWDTFDKLRKAMSVRQTRYAGYQLQMSSLISAYLMAFPPKENDVTLTNFLDLQRSIAVKHSHIQEINKMIVDAYDQKKSGLEAINIIKSEHPQTRPTREEAQIQEDKWKTFLVSLQNNPAITGTLKYPLGKDFADLQEAASLFSDPTDNESEDDNDDESDDENILRRASSNKLTVNVKIFERSLSLLDYVKARIQHFSVVWYAPEVVRVVSAPIASVQALSLQQPQPVVHSQNDDDEVVPPAPQGGSVVLQESHPVDRVVHQEIAQSPSNAVSPRGTAPISSAPASPHDSPVQQRRSQSYAPLATPPEGQRTPVTQDPLSSGVSTSSNASSYSDIANQLSSQGGRGGKAGRVKNRK